MPAQPEIHSAQASHTGRVRTANEDCVGIFEPVINEGSPDNLYLVCDGMGGHQAGEIASKIIVQEVAQAYVSHLADHGPAAALSLALQQAHEVLCERVSEDADLQTMGTTAVAAVLHQDALYIANIGDSRAYLLRAGKLEQITKDHSLVTAMVDAGAITEQEAAEHKDRSVLTRSISASRDSVEPDMFQHNFGDGDALLLCSDGLWGQVSHGQIESTVSRLPPERAVDALVNFANRAGGGDNISAIIVRRGPLQVHKDAETQEFLLPESKSATRLPAWAIALIVLALAGLALFAAYLLNWLR